nr:reverse transcriptase domain-containing protein [Tanacetum cinerariifolium]
MDRSPSDAALQEYRDKNYHQLLSIIAEKVHQEKVQQEKLKAVKVRLNFEEVLQHSESETPNGMRDLKKRLGSRHIRSLETRERMCPDTQMTQGISRTIAVVEILRAVTRAPAQEEQSLILRNIITKEYPHTRRKLYQKVRVAHEDTKSQDQRSKGQALKMTIYSSHGFKVERRDVKGAPEIMRISGFMHGITNPELIKRLYDKIPKSVDEMMRITTYFLRGEVAAGNQEKKKSLPPWKQQEAEYG